MLYDFNTASHDETAQCSELILQLQRKSNIPALLWKLDATAMEFLIDEVNSQFLCDCHYGAFEPDFVGKCYITVRLIESMLEAKQSGRDESDYWQSLTPNSDYARRDAYIVETFVEYLAVTDDLLSDALSCGTSELEWTEALYSAIASFKAALEAMLN